MPDPNACFTLRVQLYRREHDPRLITITAFDDLPCDERGAFRITVEVKHGRDVIFPRGQLVCTCAPGWTTDGIRARDLVMDLVAMAPDAGSGVGDDYWEGYTPDQLAWANRYWEALNVERQARYCDPETGEEREP
jgi:hypothetical protein